MAIILNTAGQGLYVYAHDTAADEPETGDAANITATISLDGAADGATNDVNPTEIGGGVYWFDLTQGETNAGAFVVIPVSATADVQLDPVLVLTQEALITTIASAVVAAAGTIGTSDLPNIVRYVVYDTTITGLTISAGWQTMELTIKEKRTDTDADALLNIIVTNGGAAGDGLIVIQKQTAAVALLTAADASLTVDQAAGTVAVYITAAATTKLEDYTAVGFDLVEYDGTDRLLRTYGSTNIRQTETRA